MNLYVNEGVKVDRCKTKQEHQTIHRQCPKTSQCRNRINNISNATTVNGQSCMQRELVWVLWNTTLKYKPRISTVSGWRHTPNNVIRPSKHADVNEFPENQMLKHNSIQSSTQCKLKILSVFIVIAECEASSDTDCIVASFNRLPEVMIMTNKQK